MNDAPQQVPMHNPTRKEIIHKNCSVPDLPSDVANSKSYLRSTGRKAVQRKKGGRCGGKSY